MNAVDDAFVGLGSNLDRPQDNVRHALDGLADLPATTLHARSRLYGSRPMGPMDQPDYVNAVAWLRTSLEPHALLTELQRLEAAAGRARTGERWGPRTLDLDLLVHGDRVVDDERLRLPHPGLGTRAFVLLPFAEIAPDVHVPGLGRIAACAPAVDESSVWLLAEQ